MKAITEIPVDLVRRGILPVVQAVQNDKNTRSLELSLYANGQAWTIPEGTIAVVRYRKADGRGGEYDLLPDGSAACNIDGNVVTAILAPQVLTTVGTVRFNVGLINGEKEISTFQIQIRVEPNVEAELIDSEDYYNTSGVNAALAQLREDLESLSAPDIAVTTSDTETTDITGNAGNQLRYSYTVGDIITLGGHTAYRINRVGVRADAGTTVRFALYAVGDGVLTYLENLGTAVADADTLAAVLTLESHVVRQDNTVILAFADTASIHCTAMPEGMSTEGLIQYADAAYAEGAEIPYTSGTTAAGDTFTAMFARSIDFLTDQTLADYIAQTDKRLEEAAQAAQGALPPVTALDDGKFLRVKDGSWAAVAVDVAEEGSY